MQTTERPKVSGDGPSGFEWCVGFIALMLTAIAPNIGKFSAADSGTGPNSPIGQFLWTAIYVLAATRLLSMRQLVGALMRKSVLLWAFLGLMVLSVLWSVNSTVTLRNSLELVGTTLVAYYLVVRYPLPRLLGLFGAVFGTLGILSAYLIVFAPGHGRDDWGSGAWSGVFQDKNNLGAAMVLAVITLAASLFTGSRLRRLAVALTLFLCAALLVGSRSATAFAAGGAAFMGALMIRLWCTPRARTFGRIAIAVFGAVVILSFMVGGLRVDSAIESLGRNSTLTGRTDFWPYLMQAIGDRPILGYGYRAFFQSSVGSDYLGYYIVQAGGWTPYHAHDSFLQAGLDGGLVGLALLVAMLIRGVVRGVRYVATERKFEAIWPLAIVGFLAFGSYTETYLGNYNTFEWILFVAAMLYPVRALALDERPRLAVVPDYRRVVQPTPIAHRPVS